MDKTNFDSNIGRGEENVISNVSLGGNIEGDEGIGSSYNEIFSSKKKKNKRTIFCKMYFSS